MVTYTPIKLLPMTKFVTVLIVFGDPADAANFRQKPDIPLSPSAIDYPAERELLVRDADQPAQRLQKRVTGASVLRDTRAIVCALMAIPVYSAQSAVTSSDARAPRRLADSYPLKLLTAFSIKNGQHLLARSLDRQQLTTPHI